MRYFLIICIASLYISCRNQVSEKRDFSGVFIPVHDPITLSVDELIVDYDSIRLEVTNESLVRRIDRLLIMDDQLYIHDGNLVFIFSKEGKFISKIDHVGKGPEEYTGIHHLSLDYVHHKIILTDNHGSEIFIYDADGKFEQIVKLYFNPYMIAPLDDGYIHFGVGFNRSFVSFGQNMDKYNVHFLDSVGNMVSYAIVDEVPGRVEIGSSLCYVPLKNGNVLYQPIFSDIIYEIDKNRTARPLYAFDNQSKFKFLSEDQKGKISYSVLSGQNELKEKEEQGYLLPWGYILNTEDYLYCNFTNWNNPVQLYYSHLGKQSITIDQRKLGGNHILKSIFIETPPIATYHDFFYVSPSFSRDFNEEEIDKLPDEKLKAYLKNTNWFNSNPLLIRYKINFPKKSE